MDELMIALDALWLCGVLSNKQRSDGVYQWQQRLLRLGRRIMAIERRARVSAGRRGKEAEVREATGDATEGLETDTSAPEVGNAGDGSDVADAPAVMPTETVTE